MTLTTPDVEDVDDGVEDEAGGPGFEWTSPQLSKEAPDVVHLLNWRPP